MLTPALNSLLPRGSGDVDGDGRDDLFCVTINVPTQYWVSFGHPVLGFEPAVLLPAAGLSTIEFSDEWSVADWDQDGVGDLMALTSTFCLSAGSPCPPGSLPSNAQLLRGRGNRTFATSWSVDWTTPANSVSQVTLAPGDFDGDGDPDLVGSGGAPLFLSIENRARYAATCPGPGPFPLFSIGSPALGNGAFALFLGGASPGRPAGLFVSTGAVAPAYCAPAIDVSPGALVLPAGGFGLVTTDGAGFASVPVPIPNLPFLQGLTVYGQWAVSDPAGGLSVAGQSFALTEARTIVLW